MRGCGTWLALDGHETDRGSWGMRRERVRARDGPVHPHMDAPGLCGRVFLPSSPAHASIRPLPSHGAMNTRVSNALPPRRSVSRVVGLFPPIQPDTTFSSHPLGPKAGPST